MNTDVIEKQIELKATPARVWRALTNHVEFGQWFGAKLDSPFVVGKTTTGVNEGDGCEKMAWNAVVQKMEPERLFSFTWHPYAIDAAVDYSKETPTLVEFRLEKIPAGTLVAVKESGFDKIPAQRRAEAFLKHEGGWTWQLKNIEEYVAKA